MSFSQLCVRRAYGGTLWSTPEALGCRYLCDRLGLLVSKHLCPSHSFRLHILIHSTLFCFPNTPFGHSSASAVVLPHRKIWTRSGFGPKSPGTRSLTNVPLPVPLRYPGFRHIPRVLGLRTLHARDSASIHPPQKCQY
jgi:hypothetical protein